MEETTHSVESKDVKKSNLKEIFKKFWLVGLIILVIVSIYSYYHWYIPYNNLKHGFVIVKTFDCPNGHSIKAHLGSMIYHLQGDPYYSRTNATNGYCFDSTVHAEQQGFRNSYNR